MPRLDLVLTLMLFCFIYSVFSSAISGIIFFGSLLLFLLLFILINMIGQTNEYLKNIYAGIVYIGSVMKKMDDSSGKE